jgi:RHS repeat-associated protein
VNHWLLSVPRARLVLRLFAEASGGTVLHEQEDYLDNTASWAWQQLAVGKLATVDCWAEVYVENLSGVPVWFDDLEIATGALPVAVVVQETHYDPWGLELAGIGYVSDGKLEHKFTYNGKEKQDQFGLGWLDYGARNYQADIGRFTKVDRFAHKYFALTPYQYGGNNPISFVDLNGDSLWINFGNNQRVLYYNGQLQNADGTEYRGRGVKVKKDGSLKITNWYLKSAVNALNTIRGTETGKDLISTLQGSQNSFTIKEGMNRFDPGEDGGPYKYGNNAGAYQVLDDKKFIVGGLPFTQIGSGGIIYWDPASRPLSMTTSGLQQTSPIITLAHEMGHGYDANFGYLDRRRVQGDDGGYEERTEYRASYFENRIRNELGIPYKTVYNHSDPQAPSLLRNGLPINMPPPTINWLQHFRFGYTY